MRFTSFCSTLLAQSTITTNPADSPSCSQSSNEREARAFVYKKLSFAFSIPSASHLRPRRWRHDEALSNIDIDMKRRVPDAAEGEKRTKA